MADSFVSEPLVPLDGSFAAARAAQGEPGVPLRFRWRKREWAVAAILDHRREFGDCAHGSGERYVRRHAYRVRTEDGWTLRLAFQRTFGRGRPNKARWRVVRIEERPASGSA